jgi:hypothetical protein
LQSPPDGNSDEWADDRLGDAHDVAAILHVPVTWVQQAGADGRLKSIKVGAYRRYRKSDVLAYIEGAVVSEPRPPWPDPPTMRGRTFEGEACAYCFGGKRWKRGGMYHMSALPQRFVLHQQLGSQLHTQLNGLWIRSRRLRPIGLDLRLTGGAA